jgi:hypothetical protein
LGEAIGVAPDRPAAYNNRAQVDYTTLKSFNLQGKAEKKKKL